MTWWFRDRPWNDAPSVDPRTLDGEMPAGPGATCGDDACVEEHGDEECAGCGALLPGHLAWCPVRHSRDPHLTTPDERPLAPWGGPAPQPFTGDGGDASLRWLAWRIAFGCGGTLGLVVWARVGFWPW